MGNRIFVAAVVLLWTGTMSWLMAARILPPFFHGERPQQGDLLEQEPNCWRIQFRDRDVGHAVSQSVPGAFDTTEVHSRVLIKDIELRKLWPFQIGSLIHGLNTIGLDMRTRLTLDSLGALSTFDTKVQLTDVPMVMHVRGRVEGPQLKVHLQSGETSHQLTFPVPASALAANELFPESKLINVDVGRRWQQEVFSPFKTSMEIVQAEVVGEAMIEHEGQRVNTRRIEYRSLSSAGVAADNTLRSVSWVAEDGTVLRQELHLMSAILRFERSRDPKTLQLAEDLLDLKTFATLDPPRPTP
jgi:hypothetical protein